MKLLSRARPVSYPSRAEKVSAIKKAVQEGTYEVDSAKVANTLIINLLNHSMRLYSTEFNFN
jgi:anti-sigma28 factor (negative regulator of flagellin synthesis)